MSGVDLTVVLTNYRRPCNVPLIAEAFSRQSEVPRVVLLVDNSPGTDPSQWRPGEIAVDDVIRFHRNAGPCCRFVAATLIETQWTLFWDDDLVPGRRAVEHLFAIANELNYEFATLGEVGRNVIERDGKFTLVRRNVAAGRCDVTCRAHLVRTADVLAALGLRQCVKDQLANLNMLRNDDVLLCAGVQMRTDMPSYVAKTGSDGRRLRGKELPAPHSQNSRPEHGRSRNELVDLCVRIGWRPACVTGQTKRSG